DASLSRHEGVLDALPLRVAQTSMVAHRGYPDPAQQGGERVDALSRRGVDDRGAAAVLKREAEAALAPLEEAEQEAVLLRVVFRSEDAPEEVPPIEPGDEDLGVTQAELPFDVFPHLPRGGGGQGRDRRVSEHLAHPADPQVGRSEIVSPLRDTVGLVDREQGHVEAADPLREGGAVEALRGDVDELDGPALNRSEE